jgi:ribonuclease T1
VLRTRRPLLALLLLGLLLVGGYLISAVRSDGPAPTGSGPAAGTSAAGPRQGGTARPTGTARPSGSARPTETGRSGGTATGRPGADGLGTVRPAELPVEAQRVLGLIEAGGPFPYSQDGTVFGNVERLLPSHQRGWYHEYTVPTPGSRDRGARRIIAGQDGARYYTADHYESFARVEGT